MDVDVMTGPRPLHEMQSFATGVQRAGFSGIVVTESSRTAYLSCAAAALAAPGLDLLTGVAVAFPRSPMVTAQIAWELAEATGGRFRLGLGTQVRTHVTRRYGAEFDHPGPRLREHVEAIRACFRAFRGDAALDYHGKFVDLSFLNRDWSPGPIAVEDPPVDVAAVNPWMLRMAGATADGVHIHPLGHPGYLRDVARPNLAAGAAEAGRGDRPPMAVIVPVLTIVGDDDAERDRWRQMVRTQLSFYASTPNYAFILDAAGHEGLTARLRERQKAGDPAGMAQLIDDDVLSTFATEATWDGLAAALRARYAGLADRLVLYLGGVAWDSDPEALERFGEVARQLVHTTPSD
jgi:probable F420-dependent oxidoreductase